MTSDNHEELETELQGCRDRLSSLSDQVVDHGLKLAEIADKLSEESRRVAGFQDTLENWEDQKHGLR